MKEITPSLQIYTIIEKLENLIDESPRPVFNIVGNKRTVDCDAVLDLLGDLKICIPKDIIRAQNLLSEAQELVARADEHAQEVIESAEKRASQTLDRATAHAENIIEDANREFEARVAEHEIYREAQQRAKQIIANAEKQARALYEDSKQYADSILLELLRQLNMYVNEVTSSRDNILQSKNMRVETVEDDYREEEDIDDDFLDDEEPAQKQPKKKRGVFSWVKEQFSEPIDEEYEESDDDTDFLGSPYSDD